MRRACRQANEIESIAAHELSTGSSSLLSSDDVVKTKIKTSGLGGDGIEAWMAAGDDDGIGAGLPDKKLLTLAQRSAPSGRARGPEDDAGARPSRRSMEISSLVSDQVRLHTGNKPLYENSIPFLGLVKEVHAAYVLVASVPSGNTKAGWGGGLLQLPQPRHTSAPTWAPSLRHETHCFTATILLACAVARD